MFGLQEITQKSIKAERWDREFNIMMVEVFYLVSDLRSIHD